MYRRNPQNGRQVEFEEQETVSRPSDDSVYVVIEKSPLDSSGEDTEACGACKVCFGVTQCPAGQGMLLYARQAQLAEPLWLTVKLHLCARKWGEIDRERE